MSAERDGRRVSGALTEARTVLSRAETALHGLRYSNDPAAHDIILALEGAVRELAPYRRIRGGCPNCGTQDKPHNRDRSDPAFNWRNTYTCEVPRG